MATYLLCDRGFVPTITLVAPRDVARAVRYHENLRAAEDTDFAIRLALAGYRFRMLEEPGAVWQRHFDPSRVSASAGGAEASAPGWNRCGRMIPPRACHGGRGWAYAKLVAHERPLAALRLYLNAVLRGCYRPSLAVIVFLQIFLGARRLSPPGRPRHRLAAHRPARARDQADAAAQAGTGVINRRAMLAGGRQLRWRFPQRRRTRASSKPSPPPRALSSAPPPPAMN